MVKVVKVMGLVLLFFLWQSCSEKLDTSQFDNLQATPTFETSIFYVKAQESLINRITGLNFFSQTFNFDAFGEAFFANRVLEGAITYELENTTSKNIDIGIEFLDVNGNVLDTETFHLDPAPSPTLQRIVAYGGGGKNLDILRNTSELRLNARNNGDNSSQSDLPDPAIVLRSSAKFTIRLK